LQRVRDLKVRPQTAAVDKGYDTQPVHDACRAAGVLPVIPLKASFGVKRGDHKPPTCEHGTWTFAGADFKRGMTKWRCPSGECKPASTWRKTSRLHPLIPRDSKRFGDLYRGRSAVEREFGRLKHEWGLGPLRVHGIEKVQLHADLGILARLASALARARAVPLAACLYSRSLREGGVSMAEIKLLDGSLVRVEETVDDLRSKVIPAQKFMPLKDRDGKQYDINTDQIVFVRDD
jgi:hypothetical protein